jgi:hypothetical protein
MLEILSGATHRFARVWCSSTAVQNGAPGRTSMLAALEINVALWGMLICAGLKLALVLG